MTFKFMVSMADSWEKSGSKNFAFHEGRVGAPWNEHETAHLLGGYQQEGKSIAQLAARHRRRVNGIVAQLQKALKSPPEAARPQPSLDKESPVYTTLCNNPNCQECRLLEKFAKAPNTATPNARPNAAVIHAFADNKDVQRLNSRKEWVTYRFDEHRKINVGDPKWQWRVKPADRKVLMSVSDRGGITLNATANLELTFNDGKLLEAKIL